MTDLSLPSAFSPSPPQRYAAFDVLHQECYDAIALATHADDAHFPAALEYLLKHLSHVFRIEEHWMDDCDHPALLPHREQHARVLAALHHVQASVMSGDTAVGRHAVSDLLPKWLALHIDTMDTTLSVALRFDERRRSTSRLQPEIVF